MTQRLSPPPRYANLPSCFLFDRELSDPIFRSLAQLHGLAWKTKGEHTPPATVLELATLRGLKERRMYDHLRELKERHLIRVENLGDGRIVIYPLRWADDTGTALPAQTELTTDELAALCEPTAKDCSATAIEPNNVVVGVVDDLFPVHQQQHDPNRVTAKDCSRDVAERLIAFGVLEGVAEEMACIHTLDQVEGWIAYARTAGNLRDPVAFVVAKLRAGEIPPARQQAENGRKRYITGKYADLIQH